MIHKIVTLSKHFMRDMYFVVHIYIFDSFSQLKTREFNVA
jgi:hypothetical protein